MLARVFFVTFHPPGFSPEKMHVHCIMYIVQFAELQRLCTSVFFYCCIIQLVLQNSER